MSVEGPKSPDAPLKPSNDAEPTRTLIRKSSATRISIATQASPGKEPASQLKSIVKHTQKLKVTEGIQTSPPPTIAPKAPAQPKYLLLKKKAPTAARRRNDRTEESEGEAPHGNLPDTASSSAGAAQGWSEHSTEEGSKRDSHHKSSSSVKAAPAPAADANAWSSDMTAGAQLWDALLDSSIKGPLPLPTAARYDPLAEYNVAAQQPASDVKQDAANGGGWGDVDEAPTPKPQQPRSSEALSFDSAMAGRGRGAPRGAPRGSVDRGRGRGASPGHSGRGMGAFPIVAHDVRVSAGAADWGAASGQATAAPTREPWGPQAKAAALAAKREGATQAKATSPRQAENQHDAASHGKTSSKPLRQDRLDARPPPAAHDAGVQPPSSKGWNVKPAIPATGPPSSGPKIRDVVKASGPAKPHAAQAAAKKPKIDLTRPIGNAPLADPLMSWDGPALATDPLRVPPAQEKVQAWAASQSALEQPMPGEDPNEIAPSMESQSNAGSAFQNLSSSISSRWSADASSDDESEQAMRRMEALTVGGAPGVKRLAPWEAKAARNAGEPGVTPVGAQPHFRQQDGFEALHAYDQSGRRGRGAARGRARGQNFMTGFVSRGRGLPVVGQTPRAFGAPAFAPPPQFGMVAPVDPTGSSSPAPPDSPQPVSKATSVKDVGEEAGGPRAEAQALVADEAAAAAVPKIRLPVASLAGSGAKGTTASEKTRAQDQREQKEEAEAAPQPSKVEAGAGEELGVSPAPEPEQDQKEPIPQPAQQTAPLPSPPVQAVKAPGAPPIYRASPSITFSSILSQIPPGHALDAEGSIWDLQVLPPVRVGSLIVKEQLEIVPALPTPHVAATAPASVVAKKMAPHVAQASASAPASAVVVSGAAQAARSPSRLSIGSAQVPVFRPSSTTQIGGGVAAASVTGSPVPMHPQLQPTIHDDGGAAAPLMYGTSGMPVAHGAWAPTTAAYDGGVMPVTHGGYPTTTGTHPYLATTADGSQRILASPLDGTVYYAAPPNVVASLQRQAQAQPDGRVLSPAYTTAATAGGSPVAYGYAEPQLQPTTVMGVGVPGEYAAWHGTTMTPGEGRGSWA